MLSAPAPKQVTLAIFPFENLLANGETALLCKALTRQTPSELARSRQLQVIGQYPVAQLEQHQTALEVSLNTLKPGFHLAGKLWGNQ